MVFQITEENITQAAQIIINGGLVAFPTETVYGLGADAFNQDAVARIFEVKQRPRFDPLIVHIAAYDALPRLANCARLPAQRQTQLGLLARNFWPGPLTLILPKQSAVPDIVTAGNDTVAVRLPAHDAACALIERSTGALAAPSANPFGYLSPTCAEHVEAQLGAKIDAILDGGTAQIGVESTVLDLCGAVPRILRPGGVSAGDITCVLGAPPELPQESPTAIPADACVSPGQLSSHYAPQTPLLLIERHDKPPRTAGVAYLYISKAEHPALCGDEYVFLSAEGSLTEAAANLFAALHRLDGGAWTQIIAEKAENNGIGRAINDRLIRAARR
ncbi:MAG: threonylcarbamoyl-AMP synthase [Spirochaetaceae bacterium]|jgi:L-threonylcarbamoyladenylate synthase|nr:threonylcarbamoyl-AMP synthase [Spirochaetaceae bacterium]